MILLVNMYPLQNSIEVFLFYIFLLFCLPFSGEIIWFCKSKWSILRYQFSKRKEESIPIKWKFWKIALIRKKCLKISISKTNKYLFKSISLIKLEYSKMPGIADSKMNKKADFSTRKYIKNLKKVALILFK